MRIFRQKMITHPLIREKCRVEYRKITESEFSYLQYTETGTWLHPADDFSVADAKRFAGGQNIADSPEIAGIAAN
jgi:hypothetical protein